jgi:hypothetical protein
MTLVATSPMQCDDVCEVGPAASQAQCMIGADTCRAIVADLETPVEALGDGEIAELHFQCTQEATARRLCLAEIEAGLLAGVPIEACGDVCADFSCDSCMAGDCNQSGALEVSDPVCDVLCLTGMAPNDADCVCAADCNCMAGTEASDPLCVVLRELGLFAPDPCHTAGGRTVSVAAEGYGLWSPESNVRVRLSKRRATRDATRARSFVVVRGSDTQRLASARFVLRSDRAIDRARLSWRLRRRGFSLDLGGSTASELIAVVRAPVTADVGAAAVNTGRVLRVVLATIDSELTLDDTQLGSTGGLPLSAGWIRPRAR